MKFWLEFVSCCGSPTAPEISEMSPPREEETSSLVPLPSSRKYRSRKRGVLGSMSGSGSGSGSGEWKPSLCAISEDNVVMMEKRNETVERLVKRKSGSHSRVRSYSYDFGRALIPTVVPAFAPTPFMF